MIHFIYRIDKNNVGDLACSPVRYFKQFNKLSFYEHDTNSIAFDKIKEDDLVIIGGGGMIDCWDEWNQSINRILKQCRFVVGWGVGFNQPYSSSISIKIQLNKFKMLGIRDWNHPSKIPFLPCVSCFIDLLDKKYKIKRRIGVVTHKDFRINLDYPTISNKGSLREIISFIGSSEIIVTSSYHACYWATLMKKKVILMNPFSTKFEHMPYPPIFYSGDLEADIKKAIIYPQALSECRALNRKFFDELTQKYNLSIHRLSKVQYLCRMFKKTVFKIKIICLYVISCFMPKTKNRRHFRNKYLVE